MNRCQKCQHNWEPRGRRAIDGQRPRSRRCPGCNTLAWDGQFRNQYDFVSIKVGETRTYAWFVGKDNMPDVRKNRNRYNAFIIFMKRSGRRYQIDCKSRGFVITRVE